MDGWAEYEIRKLGGVVACTISDAGAAILLTPNANAASVTAAASSILTVAGLALPIKVLGGVSGAAGAMAVATRRPALVAAAASLALLTVASSVAALTGNLPFRAGPPRPSFHAAAPAPRPRQTGPAPEGVAPTEAPALPAALPAAPVAIGLTLAVTGPKGLGRPLTVPAILSPALNTLPPVKVPVTPPPPNVVVRPPVSPPPPPPRVPAGGPETDSDAPAVLPHVAQGDTESGKSCDEKHDCAEHRANEHRDGGGERGGQDEGD